MSKIRLILLSDGYKFTHWTQYPPGTEYIRSYFESRGGEFSRTVFFGLQYYLKEFLEGVVVAPEDIPMAERFCARYFGQDGLFNTGGWEHIVREHGGRLPVSIRAVPEGSVVNTQNVLMTIENTDPAVPWLTNFLETLLAMVWYPMTVATLSREMKKLVLQYLHRTGGDPAGIEFKLHDFGFRGVSSLESAGLGGMAHLVNFEGTDTTPGILFAEEYYEAEKVGASIPASEHSTITAWGRDREADAFENMLAQFPEGLVACVSDSYDIYEACSKIWGEKLKDKVLGRKGTLVVRPDSGDPPVVVCQVLDALGKAFGYTRNEKGFKVLPPEVRVIQGDGIDYVMTRQILSCMDIQGWSAENIAFGMGGALLQKLNRDTQKCAFKCSEATVNGEDRDVWKDPVTDPGKRSKAGRLKLLRETGAHGPVWRTVNAREEGEDQLVEVFRNGEILREYTFDEVRQRAGATYTV